MTFSDFEAATADMLDEIPATFLEGLQGVHVLEPARPEPQYHGVYRLGEYLDPGPDQFLGGNPGVGRQIALYYGSFVALARANPAFDWEGQLWDTLTHELRHHVESRAGDVSLIEVDRQRNRYFKKHFSRQK